MPRFQGPDRVTRRSYHTGGGIFFLTQIQFYIFKGPCWHKNCALLCCTPHQGTKRQTIGEPSLGFGSQNKFKDVTNFKPYTAPWIPIAC